MRHLGIAVGVLLLIAGGSWAVAASVDAPHVSTLERELALIDARVKPGVAAIRAVRPLPGSSAKTGSCDGSGVILDGGFVATTLSVAGPGDDITVTYSDGRKSPASVVRVDPIRELVILKPDRPGGTPLVVASADSLHAGSWVFVLGFAFRSPEALLSMGRFSSRTSLNLTESASETLELLQLEASVFPGNSGGAVIDARGRMIGLILGSLGSDGFLDPAVLSCVGSSSPENPPILTTRQPLGISFALPATEVANLAHAGGRTSPRSYLGVRVANQSSGDGPAGVPIQDVVLGSPAAQAGLRPGERIVRVNEAPVSSHSELAGVMSRLQPGLVVRVDLVGTDGAPRRAQLTVGDYTADYRLCVVWSRLLWGRSGGLEGARATLEQNMTALDRELERVRSLSVPGTRAAFRSSGER
jgi:S1-C subfamily serine protease